MKKDARLCMSTCVHVYSKAGLVLSHKVLLYFLLLSSEAVENIMCACVSQRRIKCEPEVAQVNTSQGGHFFMLTHVQVHPKVVLVASQVCLFFVFVVFPVLSRQRRILGLWILQPRKKI